jgi:hypothetical protein
MEGDTPGSLNGIVSDTAGEFEESLRLTSNIFRREWPIVSNPYQVSSGDDGSSFHVAWEEKTTIHVSNPLTQGGPRVRTYLSHLSVLTPSFMSSYYKLADEPQSLYC